MKRRLTTLLSGALALTPLVGLAAPVALTLPPERWLSTAAELATAHGRLFVISRLLLPVCDRDADWRFGPGTFRVSDREPVSADARQRRELAMQAFDARIGDTVMLADAVHTPWATAGLRRGDRWLAGNLPQIGAVDTAASGPADGGDTASASGPLTPRDRLNAELSRQPERMLNVRRGTQERVAKVRALPVCALDLDVLDSRHVYADAQHRSVQVSLPLLRQSDQRQLDIVLMHEAAHVVLGHTGTAAELAQLGARALFGVLAEIGQNSELGRSSLPDKQLIDADRLSLWALRGLGITPIDYRETLQALDTQSAPLGTPCYSQTRPLTPARRTALDEAAALWQTEKKLRLPAGVAREKLAALVDAARAWRTEAAPAGAAVTAASDGRIEPPPTSHTRRVPEASGYADLSDVDKVPVREEGKPRYRHYLGLPSPKALVVLPTGGWRFVANEPAAMTQLLDWCATQSTRCWLYAVDDRVVWHADPARRIGRSDQLQSP